MVDTEKIIDISILKNQEELIIKPFHSTIEQNKIKDIEYGEIVSRFNKHLFDYQIGERENTSMISSIFNQKIILRNPETNEIILELYHNRFPFLYKIFSKQNVQYLTKSSNEIQSIGSIQQRLAFAKTWYDVYNTKHEHVASLILHKNYIRSKIQHRIPEFEILDNDKQTNIGRIYPFSTNLERTKYGHAIAIKIPKDLSIEIKATLLMNALILKSRIN